MWHNIPLSQSIQNLMVDKTADVRPKIMYKNYSLKCFPVSSVYLN